MDISVIIPVYNSSLLIERCLDSVFNQTTQYSIEVILVDDGSTDETLMVVDAYNSKLLSKGDCRKVLRVLKQSNSGPAKARNEGLKVAIGRYCAYLDGDDYWIDGYVEKTISFLASHEECVAVSVAQKHCVYGGADVLKPSCYSSYNFPIVLTDFFLFWANYNHVCTGSVTMKRGAMLEIGGQRTDMRVCEDLEFWLNIATLGKWGFIPQILFVSDGGLITKQQGWKKYALRFRNVPDYKIWFDRLEKRLTISQVNIIKPQLNGIICGISRAMMAGGEFARSYENLKSIFDDAPSTYLVKIHKLGKLSWYVFCSLWRTYQFVKINKGYFLGKF